MQSLIINYEHQLVLHEKYQFTITLSTKLGILLDIILCNLYANRLGIEDDKKLGSLFGYNLVIKLNHYSE